MLCSDLETPCYPSRPPALVVPVRFCSLSLPRLQIFLCVFPISSFEFSCSCNIEEESCVVMPEPASPMSLCHTNKIDVCRCSLCSTFLHAPAQAFNSLLEMEKKAPNGSKGRLGFLLILVPAFPGASVFHNECHREMGDQWGLISAHHYCI